MTPQNRIARISQLTNLRRYQDALTEIRLLIADEPNGHIGYVYKSMCEFNLNDIPSAEQSILYALSIEPEHPYSHTLLSRIYVQKRQLKKALQAADTALVIDPEYIDGYVMKAIIFLEREKYDEAINVIEQGLRLNPNDVDLLELKARYGFGINDMSYVKEGIDAALREDPDNPELQLLYAYRKMEMGDFKAAEEILYSAVVKDPSNENIKMALVECKKGKSWLFGLFYQYGFSRWTYKFTGWSVLWLIIGLKGFLLVTFLFSLFMLFAWYGDVMYNSFLRLGKRSKYLLSQMKIRQSNYFILVNVITIVIGFLAYQLNSDRLWNFMVFSIMINLIGISFFEMETQKGKKLAAIFSVVLVGIPAILLPQENEIWIFTGISLVLLTIYGLLFSFRIIGK